MSKFLKRTLCIGMSLFLVLSLAGTSALVKSAGASFSDHFAFAQDVESSNERTAHKDECFVSDDNDEGRNIVFKVIDESNRLVQVGCGSSGKTYVINDEGEVTGDRTSYATITDTFSGTLTIPEQVTYAGVTYTVTKIASSAFAYYKDGYIDKTFKLKKLVLPSTVTEIGENAFNKADLSAGIAFSDECNITTIGNSAFNRCGIYTFAFPESLTSFGNSVFYECENLNKVTFPQNCKLTELPSHTFYSCKKLNSIEIPSSMTSIGSYAFYKSGIKSFKLPEQIKSLGAGIFKDCEQLAEFDFSEASSISEIPDYMFSGCSKLTSFTVPSFIESIESYAFSESGLKSFNVPKTCTYLGASCFRSCTKLASFTFDREHQLLNISDYLFAECTSLSKIELPENIRTIGKSAFQECTALLKIELPAKVSNLGGFAFAQCASLETVIYLGNANKISSETSTFYKCQGIKNVVYMKKKSKTITYTNANPTIYYAINYYTSLENAENDIEAYGSFVIPANSVPSSVSSTDAFSGELYGAPQNCNWVCQDGCSFDGEITDSFYAYSSAVVQDMKVGDTFTAKTAEGIVVTYTITSLPTENEAGTCRVGSDALTAAKQPAMDAASAGLLNLPDSATAPDANSYTVTEISPYAFVNCNKFVELNIPASVKSIGEYAFYRCSMLRNITFEADASSIVDSGIFASCGNIKTVIFGGKKANISFGTSSPEIFYSVFCYDSKHDKEIDNKAATVIVRERAKLSSLSENDIKSGKIPDIAKGYEWKYEDGFGADIPLTDSCFMYMQGIGFQANISVRLGNVNKTPCWFKILSFDEESKTGTVQVGLGVDGVTAISGYVEGMPIIPASIKDEDGNTYSVISIGDYAFGSSTVENAQPYITSVIMASRITKIGKSAFENCEALNSISLPSQLIELGEGAFKSCTALTTVSVAGVNSLKEISKDAFRNCEKLSSFTIPPSVETICTGAFADCVRVYINEYGAVSYADGLKNFSIPKNSKLRIIEEGAFSGSYNLTATISFPAGLEKIGSNNFASTKLNTVEFYGTSTTIGDKAFYECMDLRTIRFYENAKKIEFGEDAFKLWNLNAKGNVVSGSLSRVEFYGKKYDNITNVIDMGVLANNNYGRNYLIYYNVSFYESQADYKAGKVYSSKLVQEDTKMEGKTPDIGEYITWRCEDGFALSSRTQNSYYAIAGKDISYASASGIDSSYYYTGGYIKPVPTLTMPDGTELVFGEDYVLDTSYGQFKDGYSNNRRMGSAAIHLRGIGDYAGKKSVTFKIVGTYDSNASFAISLDQNSFTYDGTEKKPNVTVTITTKGKSYEGEEGKDYKVSYLDNVKAGTGQVVVEGMGIFSSVKSADFTINPLPISRCSVNELSANYDPLRMQLDVSVSLSNPYGISLVNEQDYTMVDLANTGIGSGTLLVKGIGNYTGVLSRSFGFGGSGGSGNGSGGADGSGSSATAGYSNSDFDGTGYSNFDSSQDGKDAKSSGEGELGDNIASKASSSGSQEGGSKWSIYAIGDVDQVVQETNIATPYLFLIIALIILLGLGYLYHRLRFEHELRPAGVTRKIDEDNKE